MRPVAIATLPVEQLALIQRIFLEYEADKSQYVNLSYDILSVRCCETAVRRGWYLFVQRQSALDVKDLSSRSTV